MILFIKLFLAHIIGDFFMQPKKWVEDKESKKLKSPKLYLHIAIHAIALGFIALANCCFYNCITFCYRCHKIAYSEKEN